MRPRKTEVSNFSCKGENGVFIASSVVVVRLAILPRVQGRAAAGELLEKGVVMQFPLVIWHLGLRFLSCFSTGPVATALRLEAN